MVKLKITTISSLILSPRMEKALYKGVDYKNIKENIKNSNIVNIDNINIIYPFYSYEERNLLPENEFLYAQEYYIPASSLKGALLSGIKNEDDNSFRSSILFQDINFNTYIKTTRRKIKIISKRLFIKLQNLKPFFLV